MKNKKRSAFTIVELVIVIAVIAILSAVLIPTFGAIIKDANIAADQTAAATLTTELQVYLKGKRITNEAELMAAVGKDGADIADKLVPKSLGYGYHFWFNVETQMFVVDTADNIKNATPAAQPITSTPADGAAAVSAVLTASSTATDAFCGVRDVFRNGYILADSAKALADAFGDVNNIVSGASYAAFMDALAAKKNDEVYGTIVTQVYDNFKHTTIRTNNGIFFTSEAANGTNVELVVPGTKILTSDIFVYTPGANGAAGGYKMNPDGVAVPTPKDNVMSIPSSVLVVEKDALVYGDGNSVVIKTNCASGQAIAGIFTPGSTDAVIADTANNKYIVTVGPKDGIAGNEDTDVLHTVDNVFVCNLEAKAPFEKWEINYDLTDNVQATEKDNWLYYVGGEEKLYLNIASKFELFIQDPDVAEGPNNKSYAIKEWSSSNPAVIDNELNIVGQGETVLTATVKNLYGEVTSQSITVFVNAPKSANAIIENVRFNMSETANTYYVDWQYSDGEILVPAFFKGADNSGDGIAYYAPYAKGSGEEFTIEIVKDAENPSMFVLSDDKKGIKVDGNGQTTIKLSIDGCLTTTFVINVIDNSKSPLQVEYIDKSESDVYKYYIGDNNFVTIGALFSFKFGESNTDLTGAIVTVYDDVDGDGVYYNANHTPDRISATLDGASDYNGNSYTPWKLTSNWKTQKLDFSDVTVATDVWVKIAPKNDSAIFIKFTLVDGTNVEHSDDETDSQVVTEVKNAIVNGNVVLQDGFTMVTGEHIDIGNKTLYGNGYVITADKYTAEKLASGLIDTYEYCNICEKHLSQCIPDGNSQKDDNLPPEKGWHRVKVSGGGCGGEATYEHRTDVVTKNDSVDAYKSNIHMISIGDKGVIDNIYIVGPVYPEMQYHANECNADIPTHDAHGNKGYYVSGIRTTGNANIINSYICGFRQPVQVESAAAKGHYEASGNTTILVIDKVAETTTIKNTVLRGGNYANLTIISGNVNLEDVTTIQDFGGMTPTVDYDSNSQNYKVVGSGVVLEDSTVPSAAIQAEAAGKPFQGNAKAKLHALIRPLSTQINITGNFVQHNWVEKDFSNIKLPEIDVYTDKIVEISYVLNTIFNGVSLEMGIKVDAGEMGRFTHIVHQDADLSVEANRITNTYVAEGQADPNKDKNELVNVGILFADVQQSDSETINRAADVLEMVNIVDNRDAGRKFGAPVSLQLTEDLKLTDGFSAADYLTDGADASIAVWTYADGRRWEIHTETRSVLSLKDYTYHYYTTPTDLDWTQVYTVKDTDKNYDSNTGIRYGSTGVYGEWFN